MKKFGLYIVTPVLAFFGGVCVLIWAMKTFLNEELGRDAGFVLIWGGLAFFISAVPFYFVLIHHIDKKFNRFRLLLYPLTCMLIFFIPTLAIMGVWSSSSFFSAEAMLFHSFFLTAGLIFGILNWLFKNFPFRKNKMDAEGQGKTER